MSNVIVKYSDWFDDDGGFDKIRDDFKTLGDDLIKEAKRIKNGVNLFDVNNINNIKEYEESAERLTETFREYNKVKKQINTIERNALKLQERLSALKKGELDDTVKLRLEIQEETKVRKAQIKQQLGLLNAYQVESKRLNELRAKYKSLRIEQGKNTKETKALKKEIDELDKKLKDVDAEVGQFQRNVGNYPKTMGRAKRAIGSLSGFIIGIFVANLRKSRGEARAFDATLEKLGSAARAIFAGLRDLIVNSLIPSLENLGLKAQRASLEFKNLFSYGDKSKELERRIAELNKEIEDNARLIENAPSLKEIFEETSEIIKTNNKALDAMLIAEAKLLDRRALLESQLVRINKLQEEQQAIADDNTLSFQVQQEALKESLRTREQALGLQKEIAETELQNAINRVNLNAREQKLGNIVNRQNVERLEFLKNFAVADKIQQENIDNLVEAVKRIGEIDKEVSVNRINNAKQLREIQRDLFEQELDFALDVFDRQKSVNERIIASDKTVLVEKQRILDETERLAESSFDNQIKLTEAFLTKSLTSQGKNEEEIARILEQINIRKLADLKDEAEIRKQLISAGVADEITQNRIREIIIERKAALQDLREAQEDINALALEDETNLLQQRKEINATIAEENADDRIKDFEETRKFDEKKYNSALEFIEKEKQEKLKLIAFEEEIAKKLALTEDEKTRVIEEAEEKRRKLTRETLEKTDALQKTKIQKIKEFQQSVYEEFVSILTLVGEKVSEALQRSVDKAQTALDNQQDAVDRQRERAQQGLSNTLAFEQKEQAKREAELIKRQKRLERVEKLRSYWNTYNANLSSLKEDEDSGVAIRKTLRDVAVIEALTATLASFGDGGVVGIDGVRTNSFGVTQGRSHNKNGGILAFHEGGEGFLSRKEMANIGMENFYKFKQLASTGPLDTNFFTGQGESFTSSIQSFTYTDTRLVKEVKSVKDAILSKPSQSLNVPEVVDGILKFTETVTTRNKVKRNHYVIKKPRL